MDSEDFKREQKRFKDLIEDLELNFQQASDDAYELS